MATDAEKEALGRFTIKNVRLGFPFLFQRSPPGKNEDGTERPGNFRASGIMYNFGEYKPFTVKNLAIIKKAKEDVLTHKFTADQKKWPKFKPEKLCVRDGNLENWDGFENSWYLSASENDQPLLLSRQKDDKGLWIPATPKLLYPGCFVNIIGQIWLQDNKHGMRINCNLKAVQYYGKGEPFAGSAPIDPSKAFTDVEELDDGDIGSGFGADEDNDDII